MKKKETNPYDALERIFHEPNRLAIMSALCAEAKGLTFAELKEECGLTDGNLSRHLKALEQADVIRIRKTFVKARPRTTVFLAGKGLDRFAEYLRALNEVLTKAGRAMPASVGKRTAHFPAGAAVRVRS